MSFALPSVKSRPTQPTHFGVTEGPHDVPSVLTGGFASAKANLNSAHPLESSELNYKKNQDAMDMTVLRNTQGLHAPLRIAMEVKAAQKVGRLPFLTSSNAMLQSLTGRDIEIDATDVFNIPEYQEVSRIPHAVVEKSLGIL